MENNEINLFIFQYKDESKRKPIAKNAKNWGYQTIVPGIFIKDAIGTKKIPAKISEDI